MFIAPGGDMSKFVILSFGVLGFAFYELSGGADFVPRSAAIKAEIARAEQAEASESALQTVANRAKIPARDSVEVAELVAAPAVSRRVETPITNAQASQVKPKFSPQSDTANEDQVVLASLERGGTTFGNVLNIQVDQAEPAIIEQTEPEAAEASTPAAQPVRAELEAAADIREVTATRVNVRTGPSTDFDVLTRVTQGQQVEVLNDNGDGWLRLRILPDDRVGWIAARLISPAG